VPAAGRREHHIVAGGRIVQSTSDPAPRPAQGWHVSQLTNTEFYVAKAFVVKKGKRQVKLLIGNGEVEVSKNEI